MAYHTVLSWIREQLDYDDDKFLLDLPASTRTDIVTRVYRNEITTTEAARAIVAWRRSLEQ